MKVLSFGEILLRLASPGYTKLFQKDSLDATFCGGEANVAVSLAILGQESSFITKVPNNDVGRAAINSMRYFGVNTSKVIYGGGRLGTYYLEKGASQRPSKVIYDRAYSSIALAEPEEFDWDVILDGVEWFHWTGINPALSQNVADICRQACVIAKKKGITVSCDLNYRGNLWSSAEAQETMTKLMPYVDVCVANEEDAEKVLGIKAADTDVENGKLDRNGYKDVALQICGKSGCKYVAITLRQSYSASRNGWSGMLYDATKGETYFSKTYDIQVVDRVGGGDSFTAGLIYALSNGLENEYAINFAVAASCLKHTMEGDYNRSTVLDIEKLISSGGNGRVQR